MSRHLQPCYACGRTVDMKGATRAVVLEDDDGQHVFVGPRCFEHIRQAGTAGFQPARGGPRLFADAEARAAYLGRTR